jgi:hypothetical protein
MFRLFTNVCVGLILLSSLPSLKGNGVGDVVDAAGDAAQGVVKAILGPSLVSADDPRVIAVIVGGLLSMGVGAYLIHEAFSNSEEAQRASAFKKICSFLIGDMYVGAGLVTVLFSRSIVTAVDEFMVLALREINKIKLNNLK